MDSLKQSEATERSKPVKKKRSILYRRPQCDSQYLPDYGDSSSLSSTPLSDSLDKASGQGTISMGFHTVAEPEGDLKLVVEASPVGEPNEACMQEVRLDTSGSPQDNPADTHWKNMSAIDARINESSAKSSPSKIASDRPGSETKVRRVKLKVGGVTHTIEANSVAGSSSKSSSTKSSSSSDAPIPKHKMIGHDASADFPLSDGGLRGVPWKDFSKNGLSIGKVDVPRKKLSLGTVLAKQGVKYEPLHNSKHVSKRHFSGNIVDDIDDNDDDEIRYLEKLRTSKLSGSYDLEYEEDIRGTNKQRKLSGVQNGSTNHSMKRRNYSSSRSSRDNRKSKSARAIEDTDYFEEEESVSDLEINTKKRKHRKALIDVVEDNKAEMVITTRQRALQTGKDLTSVPGLSLVEFPNGLQPAPPKKQKEQLSEVEQQLKKAEAAQRRRMQAEKAARESQAEAIRRILGQDSSRKKREEKIKKRQEELAQERSANVMAVSTNAVRWIMGPSGTVVTFPDELGFPSIFEPKTCRYPPPREKCAGPSCTNTFKYRDSKSKLPLCSLHCYKAIREKLQPVAAC